MEGATLNETDVDALQTNEEIAAADPYVNHDDENELLVEDVADTPIPTFASPAPTDIHSDVDDDSFDSFSDT